jgi:hypothetical protein
MKAEIEKIARTLEEEGRPFAPEEVKRVIDESGVEVKSSDLDELVQGVLEEGLKRTLSVLDKAWELLGVPPHPEAENLLREGGEIHVWYSKDDRGKDHEVGVRLVDKTGTVVVDGGFYSPPMGFYSPEEFMLRFGRGLVVIETSSGVVVGRSWAFFKGHDSEKLENAADTVYVLRPILTSMGISSMGNAFEELSYLGNGEVQVEGEYILARDEKFWLLRRGTIFGDPTLDRALVSGETVAFSFPEDVEVGFKVFLDDFWVNADRLYIAYTRIRWGEEAVVIGGGRAPCRFLDKGSLTKAIQSRLKQEIALFEVGKSSALREASLEMITFLKALSDHEDPFKALAEGKFRPHITAQMFLDM